MTRTYSGRRALRDVTPIGGGPKVIVTTGDANATHLALKAVAPQGKRYICAVIDPASAVYTWEALEAVAFPRARARPARALPRRDGSGPRVFTTRD
jgi:hypothetical protein